MEFQFVVIIGALCGLSIVVGSIYLLRTGAIKLANASNNDALSIEVARQVKITTSYPALGMFVIGLIFVLGSAYLAKPIYNDVSITGTLSADNYSGISGVQVLYSIPFGTAKPDQDGVLTSVETHSSPPSKLEAKIIASGYDSASVWTPLKQEGDGWKLEYDLGKRVGEKPSEENRSIAEAHGLPSIDSNSTWNKKND